jgi:hypothetical protein
MAQEPVKGNGEEPLEGVRCRWWPDRSDRNQALNNKLGPNVAAEHIDIKEGTEGGVIACNTFDGQGISGQNNADSCDGYQVHSVVDGYGCGNTFRGNDSNLGGAGGYAINVTNQKECGSAPNVVYANNKVQKAAKGLTNVDVTG